MCCVIKRKVYLPCFTFAFILWLIINRQESGNDSKSAIKLFCMILVKPEEFETTRVWAILNAWVYECDNYVFVTQTVNYEDWHGLNSNLDEQPLRILHPYGLNNDSYNKLSFKVMLAIKEIYVKHKNQFDWFLKTDLDTFVHVKHLREFLMDKNTNDPVTFGYDLKLFVPQGYHSGRL